MVTAKSNAEKILAAINNKEALAAYNMEKKYLKSQKRAVYIPLEDVEIDWFWDHNQVMIFDELWNIGVPLSDIAEELDKTFLEALLMMADRAERKFIKPRKGGL